MEPEEYDTIAALEDRHWWYLGMRQIAAGLIRQLPGAGSRAWRVLDAGCGTGGGLRWLSEFGMVTGFDLHPLAVRHAAARGPVVLASIQAPPFGDGQFDLVTSFEVLYHLAVTDDRAAVAALARVLRPGGWLVLRVPAYDWLRGAHDRQVHTRHRYSRAEVRRLLEAAGLRPCRLTYVGLLILIPAMLARLAQPRPGPLRQPRSDVTLPGPGANRALLGAMRLEAGLLRLAGQQGLPAGLSVLAVAQK
jgi:SAM-dependent methyltransferase